MLRARERKRERERDAAAVGFWAVAVVTRAGDGVARPASGGGPWPKVLESHVLQLFRRERSKRAGSGGNSLEDVVLVVEPLVREVAVQR